MMRSRAVQISLAALLAAQPLSGCLTLAAVHQMQEQREYERRNAFDASAHDWSLKPGEPVTGQLTLTAAYERQQGAIKSIAEETQTYHGLAVRLVPDTPHMRTLLLREYGLIARARGDWRDTLAGTTERWAGPEAASVAYVREAACGPEGVFTFSPAPAGRYLLQGQVRPISGRSAFIANGLVLQPVTLEAGQPLNVHIRSDVWRNGVLTPR